MIDKKVINEARDKLESGEDKVSVLNWVFEQALNIGYEEGRTDGYDAAIHDIRYEDF